MPYHLQHDMFGAYLALPCALLFYLQSLTSSNPFALNALAGAASLGLVAGSVVATRAAAEALRSRIEDATKELVVTGTRVAVYGIFFTSVFLAARAVLEL